MLLLGFGMVFVLGIANQQASTCAVAAADEIVREGRFTKIASFALGAAVSALVLSLNGAVPIKAGVFAWTGVIGGVIAAFGASLNGRCAMGTIASLGRGRLDRVGTLLGFFAGAVLVTLALPAAQSGSGNLGASPTMIPVQLAVIMVAATWYLARSPKLMSLVWMALIGLLNAILIVHMYPWSYTSNLTALAMGQSVDLMQVALFMACLIGGSLAAAKVTGTLQFKISVRDHWQRSIFGGVLMGAGSALVPGGNDTMLLLGVPLLLSGLLAAHASFWITLLAVRWQVARKVA